MFVTAGQGVGLTENVFSATSHPDDLWFLAFCLEGQGEGQSKWMLTEFQTKLASERFAEYSKLLQMVMTDFVWHLAESREQDKREDMLIPSPRGTPCRSLT